MAIRQPALFDDFVTLGANNNNTHNRKDALSHYYENTSSIPITAAAPQSLIVDPAAAAPWSQTPSTATPNTISSTTSSTIAVAPAVAPGRMPGHHAIGSSIDMYGHGGDSSQSPSPEQTSHRSDRTSSTSSSNKSSRSRASISSKSSAPSTESTTKRSRARSTADDGSRRDKFLERNRIAASKCRQRKKEWVSGLEEAKNGLETQNSQLQMEYNGLLGEVSRMKNQIMAHASCHDPNIDKWIDNEARRFVQAPETGGEFQSGGVGGYGGFPDAAPPPFPMDYQFEEGE